ncbi:MAG: hypothetical protein M2R45_04006 [Verrucomicrobia subdivision 3 bacterium]|nr:hypothetical protein [Limisphaerales bacterium]MCS1416243.1 hypothetical protein [Limisphaerales bacterium]
MCLQPSLNIAAPKFINRPRGRPGQGEVVGQNLFSVHQHKKFDRLEFYQNSILNNQINPKSLIELHSS